MSNTKKKFAFWLTPKTKELVERSYQLDNSQSQSEFIEKAIQFYTGYLEAEQDGSYLPVTLSATLEGSLGALGDRLGKLLFKMSVEMSMMMHLIPVRDDISYLYSNWFRICWSPLGRGKKTIFSS